MYNFHCAHQKAKLKTEPWPAPAKLRINQPAEPNGAMRGWNLLAESAARNPAAKNALTLARFSPDSDGCNHVRVNAHNLFRF
jgi:hypothetical protein